MEFKTVKYEIDLKHCPIKGAVFLKKPSIDQLFQGTEIAKKLENDQIQGVRELIDWSKKFYTKIELKNIDGTVYTTFEQLTEDSESLEVLNDVASALVIGINKKKLQEAEEKKPKKD